MNDINDRISKLEDIKIENFIWVIYVGIIFLSWYANSREKKYLLYNDEQSKREYQNLLILIFSILVIVYYYFTKDSYDDYIDSVDENNDRKKNLHLASFVGSFLVLISGVIFLSIAIMDENIDVELAFS